MVAAAVAVALAALPPIALDAQRPVSLDGIWELRLGENEQPWQQVRVPGALALQRIDFDGVVWFRTDLNLPGDWGEHDGAVRVPMAPNAYEVFLNGTLVGRRGQIGPAGELVEKDFRSSVFRLPRELLREGQPNTLGLRLRTFYGNGGVVAPGVLVGTEQVVREEHERLQVRATMLCALFFFAGFFHLVLFAGRRRERHHLSFALISLMLAAVTAGINTLGYQLTSSADFNAYLVFIPLLWLPALVVRFSSEFFDRRVRWWQRITLGLGTAGTLVLMASSAVHAVYPLFERAVLPLTIVELCVVLAASLWWTIAAQRAGQLGAGAILFGVVAYAVSAILELGWTMRAFDFHVDSSLGFAVLVGSMVVAIASRFAWLHQQVELGERDVLTGCLTRHGFRAPLDGLLERQDSTGGALSCILMDLDHFKQVNDSHGHNFGDDVLRAAGAAINRSLRGTDVVARWGGEEFLILVPDQELPAALEIAKRVQNALRAIEYAGRPGFHTTGSFGVASRSKGERFEEWVARADRALYEAKQAGRDCVRAA